MNLKSIICKGLQRIGINPYHFLDSLYLPLDRKNIRRTKNIRLIPNESARRGGKYSYAEWAHVIGIFQTLMFLHLQKKEGNKILDVGCGTGLLGIASEPFIGGCGKYSGIDVMKNDIAFCRGHYPSSNFEFIHFDVANPAYTPAQKDIKSKGCGSFVTTYKPHKNGQLYNLLSQAYAGFSQIAFGQSAKSAILPVWKRE